MADNIIPILQIAGSLVGGGLAGGVVNLLFTSRQKRMELGLQVTKEYFTQYSDIARAKKLLVSPTTLQEHDLNHIQQIGGWLNMIARLYIMNTVDKELVYDVELIKEMDEVYRYTEAATTKNPSLNPILQNWVYLRTLHNDPSIKRRR
jgi:hypothetical protein